MEGTTGEKASFLKGSFKKMPLGRVTQRLFGGGEGNRTPVREHSAQQPYVCSR